MDSSWGMFKQMLQYKANRIVEVDPYNTSVECSKCGDKVPKALTSFKGGQLTTYCCQQM